MLVRLNERETYIAKLLARWRMNDSLRAGLANVAGAARYLSLDVTGAVGELAVAKALGLYPGFTVGTFKLPDVGAFQVRTTRCAGGRLLIRPGDADEDLFVLVSAQVQPDQGWICELAGWCAGWEARRSLGEWMRPDTGRPAAWVVEQEKLHPMRELVHREWVRG